MTLLSREVPELDIARVSAACRGRVEEASPALRPLALRLLAGLEPKRWTLEWYLPWWLGHAFGLDLEVAHELVVSNVLGLASIRLQDDLADGDVGAGDLAAAKTLSAALYTQALAPYRARLPASSPFWSHLAASMAAWDAATHAAPDLGSAGSGRSGRLDSRRLAARGAPLKISAFAVCLLTAQADAFPVLDGCLDHALAGLVLYDHIGDWQDDLAAGRWNAFIAGVSDDPQTPEFRERNRARMLLAMMHDDAIATQFARIGSELSRAAALSDTLGLRPLSAYLRGYAALAAEQGDTLQAHYHDVAERAGRWLLGASPGARSGDGHIAAAVRGTR